MEYQGKNTAKAQVIGNFNVTCLKRDLNMHSGKRQQAVNDQVEDHSAIRACPELGPWPGMKLGGQNGQ